jgi:hypothetical protein
MLVSRENTIKDSLFSGTRLNHNLIDMIAGYEGNKLEKIKVSIPAFIRNMIIMTVTLGIWRAYQNYRFNSGIERGDEAGLKKAASAIRWGARGWVRGHEWVHLIQNNKFQSIEFLFSQVDLEAKWAKTTRSWKHFYHIVVKRDMDRRGNCPAHEIFYVIYTLFWNQPHGQPCHPQLLQFLDIFLKYRPVTKVQEFPEKCAMLFPHLYHILGDAIHHNKTEVIELFKKHGVDDAIVSKMTSIYCK